MSQCPEKEYKSIHDEYFELTKKYQKTYEKSCVLLEVGSFFELYTYKNNETQIIKHEFIVELSQICNLNLVEKKISYDNNHQMLMMGFRNYMLDKYVKLIVDAGFTVVVYVQEKDGKNTKRVFHSIFSPGTYISYETDSSPQITNNIMCIWMDVIKSSSILKNSTSSQQNREIIICGLSVANIFTGKSSIFEYETSYTMNPTTFDELERSISMFSPSEVIIISPFDNKQLNTIIQYSNIKTSMIHKIDSREPSNEKVQNCMKQNYIKHILSTFYGDETYQICSEFNTHTIATQSFCYLLNFIQEHNSNLVRKIGLPNFNNTSDRMILANHTLKQLNIIDDNVNDEKMGHLTSVLSYLNKCCTAMGKRRFKQQLLNPVFDEKWLNNEYDIIEVMMQQQNVCLIGPFRKILLQIRDIEKICRQLVLQKIYPSSIYHLYKSIEQIQQINTCLYESNVIYNYLCSDFAENDRKYIDTKCSQLMNFINQNIVIENCKGLHSANNFEQNIICGGVSPKLDEYIQKNINNIKNFNDIREHLNNLMKIYEKTTSDIEFIKEHETEKSGVSLQITKKRGQTLKKILQIIADSGEPILNVNENIAIPAKDFKLVSASTANDEIECAYLNKICKEMLFMKEKINQEIAIAYSKFILVLEQQWLSILENFASYISKLDVLQNKAYVALENKYCKPSIDNSAVKSFVDAKELRHVLIEHINQNEIYVSNNVLLGKQIEGKKSTDGILLFGTNAVGKTSMIRAIGIAIILAQSGMYVPCSQFIYKPYTSIFSRILGNDNIFKGLSTFAVEMSELRVILRMADEYSLILGDELCSGTENESALSIFVSGLMHLHNKQSSFIFATHFHEVIHYDEIKQLNGLKICHMSVYYDRELDCLVYDRKIKEGQGSTTYGLEVCSSLHLPKEFMDKSYEIRNKYFPETKGELQNITTQYNSKKIRGLCEICKENIGEEIHHIEFQKNADDKGFINHFHKNHQGNLLSVCQKCHDKIHFDEKKAENVSEPKKIVKRKTTKGYKVL